MVIYPLYVPWLLSVSYKTRLITYLFLIGFYKNTAEPMKPAFVKPIKDLKVVIGQPMLLEAQIVGFPVSIFLY